MSLRPARAERHEPAPSTPYAPRPKPLPPGPHQLGNATLANVDQLTGMTAEEIEKLAEQVEDAGRDTADVLREAARRVRHSGMVANERLANFVRVASTCADAAKMMQQSVALRNEVQPEPPTETKGAPAAAEGAAPLPVNLDAIETAIGDTMAKSGAAP